MAANGGERVHGNSIYKFTGIDGGHGNYYTLVWSHRIEEVGNHCYRKVALPGNTEGGMSER